MAATVSVRLPANTHQRLRNLAKKKHKGIGEVVDEAIVALEREQFWREMEEGYAKLRADPEAWKEWQDEVAIWDSTLMDGIPTDDEYAEEYKHAADTETR
jgi:predicted DNA-binding protein